MTEKILQLNTEKNIFWGLVGILFLCAGLYIYIINTTVHNVVMREQLENKATQLTLSIGTDEYRYISLRNAVTMPLAYSMGFTEAPEKVFLSKEGPIGSGSYLARQ